MLWTSNVVVLLYIVLIFSCSFHFRYSQRPKYYWNLRVGRSCEPLLQIKACWGLLLIPWVFPLPIHVPWHLPSPYLRLSLKYLGLFLTHSFLMHWEFPSPYVYLFKLCADILGFLSGLYRRLSWLYTYRGIFLVLQFLFPNNLFLLCIVQALFLLMGRQEQARHTPWKVHINLHWFDDEKRRY